VLILASASQSRKKLLENCQIEFIQISSDFDETTIQEKNILNLALELSFQKANSLSEKIQEISFPEKYGPLELLGCDSIFEFKGEAYGKPSNKEEAFIRWKKMSGEFGFLHTGHTLIIGNFDSNSKIFKITEIIKKTVSSKVYFSNLEDLNFLIRNILKISNEESLEIISQSIPEKNPILYIEKSLKIL